MTAIGNLDGKSQFRKAILPIKEEKWRIWRWSAAIAGKYRVGKMLPVGKFMTICVHFPKRSDKIYAGKELATSARRRFALTRFISWL
jgi:hypothetical protein